MRNWMSLISDNLLDTLVLPRKTLPTGQNFVRAPKSASDFDEAHPQARGAVRREPMYTPVSTHAPNNVPAQTLPGFRLGSSRSSNAIEVGTRCSSGDNNIVRDFER